VTGKNHFRVQIKITPRPQGKIMELMKLVGNAKG